MPKIKKSLKEWCEENNRLDLLDEWDYEKNGELTPNDISYGSAKDVFWLCKNNHSFVETANYRTSRNLQCPICSSLEFWCKQNDKENILTEFDYDKNFPLLPNKVSYGSHKEIWWKCPQGHSFKQQIKSHTLNGNSCPYCSTPARKVLPGFNDFETYCKNNNMENILDEWDYDKNDFTPNEIIAHSGKKVWWKCKHGHEWQARIDHRCSGVGCPQCSNQTSFPEHAILYYLTQYFPNTIHRCKDFGVELDIYIPQLKTAIEYDSYIYHQNTTDKEYNKNLFCKNNNIKLIRIREEGLCSYDNCICIFRENITNKQSLEPVLILLFQLLKIYDVNINIKRDNSIIMENYRLKELQNSLAIKCPQLIKEWHKTKNGKLNPNTLTVASGEKVWWQCKKGHEWQAIIASRTRTNGCGCPYCSGKKVLKGYNDLVTINPDVAKQWHPIKNAELKPSDVTANSGKKVWWQCEKGHEWQAIIASRTRTNGCGCPYCSGKKVQKGDNDFETYCKRNHLEYILEEWNYDKNLLMPHEITPFSNKKVWWRCKCCGYNWNTTTSHRINGTNCPNCCNHITKKVRCIETKTIYQNAHEATQESKINNNRAVARCCCGEQKTAGGYHWEYADEDPPSSDPTP